MAVSLLNDSRITPSDRLGLSLVTALFIHAVVIFGINFTPEDDKPQPALPTVEITLVHHESEQAPEEADQLAQANLAGGGKIKHKGHNASPRAAPLVKPTSGQALVVNKQQTRNATPQDILREQITADNAQRTAMSKKRVPKRKREPEASELISHSMEIASLSAEIKNSMQDYAQRPRHHYISASTREFRDAAYLESWRRKIERIGNLNYPEQAKRNRLSGSMILDVALNPDGSTREITIRQSSGSKILDDAAIRIVRLAAPFAPFPEEMRKEIDVLHITRTWQFLSGNRFTSR